jgi:uncharacterized protein (DUF697 family)
MEMNVCLTESEKIKCNAIIHSVSAAAGAAGVIPIGPADTIMITPLQIGMVISLGGIFGIRVTESIAKSIIGGLAASFVGRAVAKTLLQFIPILGWVINFFTASGITEAIGWGAVAHFHNIRENHSKYAGKKEGYLEASAAYEQKLRTQANEFFEKQKIFMSERSEYTKLLDDLTQMTIELSTRPDADTLNVIEKRKGFQNLIDKLKNLPKEV